jgi:alanyl-tRNA synthetase
MPSNEGRGYVLRRLIRRAAIHAQRAGLRRPLTELAVMVGAEMREPYPELQLQMPAIQGVLGDELVRFNRTVEQGLEQFEKVAAQHPITIPGADAFRLHDTYGFPLELTRELAAERGIEVDEQGFRASMEEQRARSRRGTPQGWALAKDLPKSEFTGYRELTTETKVFALRKDDKPVEVAGEGDAVEVFLERTPFYAESGGQVGDTGTITTPNGQIQSRTSAP